MKKMILMLITVFLFSSIPVHAAVKKENRLWQDETVYSIMIDRFNDGDTKNDSDVDAKDPLAYNGGDLQGIIDKLDYIHDMGFTAIRLTPIFDNAKNGYHGFWVEDFYKIDEHFGTMKTFQELVKQAHKRKMKVIIDFVTNNVAVSHPWVSDSSKQDWFHKKQEIHDWTNQAEVENGWVDGLPDLNQDNPEVKKYLIDAAKWWIAKSDIDGFSLPEINQVPLNFYRDFATEVKKEKKDFFLLGIISKNSSADLKDYEAAGIDSLFDYSYNDKLRKALATTNQSFSNLYSDAVDNQPAFLRPNFMDDEYTVRFTHNIVEKRQYPGSRWKTGLTYLYTTPGIPIVYYGTEIALNGGEIPDNRKQLSFRSEKDLIEYITKISELRNQLPSLTRGTMEMLYDQQGMVVYKRVYKGETSVIAINNTSKSQKVILTDKQLASNKELRGLLGGDIVRGHENQYIIILDRDHSEIYVQTEKSGINGTHIGLLILVIILAIIFLTLIIKRRKNNQIE